MIQQIIQCRRNKMNNTPSKPVILRETQVPQDVYTKEEQAQLKENSKKVSINDIFPGA